MGFVGTSLLLADVLEFPQQPGTWRGLLDYEDLPHQYHTDQLPISDSRLNHCEFRQVKWSL